jgi:cysteine desulfurase family protein (TIGR01976 family)
MRPPDQDFFEKRRRDFPSLTREVNGHQAIYLDGPAGTQVPESVIDAVSAYYRTSNANTHGTFAATQETDRMLERSRNSVAAFLGASGPDTISFGANMTTLNFSLSRAIARMLKPGDEILITQLDHEANRGPWLTLAEGGISIKEVCVLPNGTLDYDDARSKISPRTRLVAMGMASNAFGTVNDFQRVRVWTREVGAMLVLDAVHFAPHFPINVRQIDPDFLLCSAYKFYGPHVGILYARPGLLERLTTDRLRTQDEHAPYRIETGTLNHASIAGVTAALEYIASCGTGPDHKSALESGMKRIAAYEHALALQLYDGLRSISGVTVRGPSFETPLRAPTVSFTLDRLSPEEVCSRLASEGIFAWDGHFYAIRPMEVLGFLAQGGVTRLGISLYNTESEIERLLTVVSRLAKESR